MIDVITMVALLAIGIVMAILATVYFYLEHNATNGLTFATNPLAFKWVLGGILGGASAAGIVIAILWYQPDISLTEALAKFGAITGALGIVVAKCFNEGISATAKWAKQKTQKVIEVAQDPEIMEMKAQLDAILKSLKGSN